MLTSGGGVCKHSRRHATRRAATLLPIAALALTVLAPRSAPAAAVGGAVVKLQLAQQPTAGGGWSGTFVIATAAGKVTDRGTVTERRYTNGALWQITRHLKGRRGNLTIAVKGASLAALEWTILTGTKAYAGLHAHGREVDRYQARTVTARMVAFPSR
jgi:hypothetical protein